MISVIWVVKYRIVGLIDVVGVIVSVRARVLRWSHLARQYLNISGSDIRVECKGEWFGLL